MSYYLRGSDGDFQGLGTVPQPAYESCGFDAACIARNNDLETQYNEAVVQNLWQTNNPNGGPMPVGWMTAGDSPVRQQQIANDYNTANPVNYATPNLPSAAVQVPASGGRVAFTSSRGSNALQVGDTWLVSITGATPNAPVTVSGSMPSGAFTNSAMGSTDSNGNFSKAGTVDASTVGTWSESWAVGGAPSGSVAFTVAPAPTASVVTPAATVPAAIVPPATGSAAGASSSSMVIGGFDLSAIPVWAWAGAAAVALLAFGGGGRGR